MKSTDYSRDLLDLNDDLPTRSAEREASLGESAVAVIETTADDAQPGAKCEKCAAPLRAEAVAICRGCGWYASLGTFVEVDPGWDAEDEPQQPAPSPKSHLRVWFELIPPWGWVIIGSHAVIVVESVFARLVTEYGSSSRTTWSLSQLALGAAALFGGHIVNFLLQVADDPDIGIFDVVLKPLKLWLKTLHRLPARLWLVNAAASGIFAAVMAIVVIGGIPYERLWDWGFTPPPKQELMGAIMDRVKKVESQQEQSLEDAIGDFAGKAGVEDPTPPPKPRKTADCVILGYTTDPDGRLNTLVLGTAHLGKLVYAGNVTPKFDDAAERADLLEKLIAAKTARRLIAIETDANWVRPTLSCRVTYGERKPDGRLTDIGWNEFVGTLRTQTKTSR